MWASSEQDNRNIISSSSSSTRSYSSSSSSSSLVPQTPRRRTIDEVWNDINLPTAADLNYSQRRGFAPPLTCAASTPDSFRGVIFKDFLGGRVSAAAPPTSSAVFLPPPCPTVLSLNSGVNFNFMAQRVDENRHVPFVSPTFPDEVIGSPPPTGLFCYYPNKKTAGNSDDSAVADDDGGGGDLRSKRMIKNRESAARSRARKQAYTNELELEVAHLVEENARLTKQYEELRSAMAAQVHTKNTIQRTSTAPF